MLRKINIEFIVAPYEADAQLAYLCKINRISAVITEDSDLLCFGCPNVLFKLDQNGNCVLIKIEDLGQIKGLLFWV
jgi:exonuclease-1